MPQSRLRRLWTLARWTLYNLALVALVVSLVHWRWMRRIPHHRDDWLAELSRESGLPIELVSSIGLFAVDRDRRDLRTLPAHRADTIRIGAFGDSFTFGDEVDASLSFPAQLEELFRKDGFTNLEVVNFGSSWHGFGQATQS